MTTVSKNVYSGKSDDIFNRYKIHIIESLKESLLM